ncbi:L-threonylcarbamoyladenylate synthase [Natronospira bacteriovora]|uniref:Threonylcarbamoyl-AMP synthase n=1 Tax=Natronospira bacteriovora TaxID=3069753 RepID=A0ABU0WA95_9GAMM|nr:L-threonylcarbamoyladenylate synthase [Natronospira sp. AB-CW4]MDQ2070892.1 L-threonylcarbamoyladenylate synthase [Natronospira sp. AB-CW4]
MTESGRPQPTQQGHSLADAVECLKAGGLVAYPTEGVFGLGCDALDGAAVDRLLALKGREAAKGLIVIGASLLQLEPLIQPLTREQRRKLEKHWPGPLTWIVPAADDAPEWLTGGRDTIAVRVPAHPIACNLCQLFRGPIVSTSANRSGEDAARDADTVAGLFPTGIDYIFDCPVAGLKGPSEIRELLTDRVIRPGGGQ